MSLSPNDQGSYPKTASGKTPPPAPSAAYAKRRAFPLVAFESFLSYKVQKGTGDSSRGRPRRRQRSLSSPRFACPRTGRFPLWRDAAQLNSRRPQGKRGCLASNQLSSRLQESKGWYLTLQRLSRSPTLCLHFGEHARLCQLRNRFVLPGIVPTSRKPNGPSWSPSLGFHRLIRCIVSCHGTQQSSPLGLTHPPHWRLEQCVWSLHLLLFMAHKRPRIYYSHSG